MHSLELEPLAVFEESEGTTLVVEKGIADSKGLEYETSWSLITLTVHSDLTSIGFLAAITKILAEEQIPMNAISAYYHDHLFIQPAKVEKALSALKEAVINWDSRD